MRGWALWFFLGSDRRNHTLKGILVRLVLWTLVGAAIGAVASHSYDKGYVAAQLYERGRAMEHRDTLMRPADPFWWHVYTQEGWWETEI